MPVPRQIIVSADDFGLTRSITDTILEVIDNGPVKLVSVLANGEAFEYSLGEYKKRTGRLELAVHVNLTEGGALSVPQEVPHLVNKDGMFKHSVLGLWFAYFFNPRAVRKEVAREVRAQYEHVRALAGGPVAVNSHQHVHLLPFVFDACLELGSISYVRTVREPLFWSGVPAFTNILARFVLAQLSRRAARLAQARGIKTNDRFVGLLYSGRMTAARVQKGLARTDAGLVEVLFHPGSAAEGELKEWRGTRADLVWHYSPWRTRERNELGKLRFDR